MKITVIHHSADFDGIFCREIARKFLGNDGVEYIGWDFKDPPLPVPTSDNIYVMDLPADRVFGRDFSKINPDIANMKHFLNKVTWIDHHKSSIETHPADIPGYRIDGVSACRLAWQWFALEGWHPHRNVPLPDKSAFVARKVAEPLAVQLAGEYDIWDKRNPDAEVFQFGLRSQELTANEWDSLLDVTRPHFAAKLVTQGLMLQRYQQASDASVVQERSFMVEFEGLTFLALNTARCNSLTFAAKDVPAIRINGFTVTGATVGERWAQFRALIEPELAAARPKPPAPEEPGNLLNPHRKGWKPPKVRKYHGKRRGYHWKHGKKMKVNA